MMAKNVDFVCANCGVILSASLAKRLLSPHREKTMWRSEQTQLYMKCKSCGQRSWMKQKQLVQEGADG